MPTINLPPVYKHVMPAREGAWWRLLVQCVEDGYWRVPDNLSPQVASAINDLRLLLQEWDVLDAD